MFWPFGASIAQFRDCENWGRGRNTEKIQHFILFDTSAQIGMFGLVGFDSCQEHIAEVQETEAHECKPYRRPAEKRKKGADSTIDQQKRERRRMVLLTQEQEITCAGIADVTPTDLPNRTTYNKLIGEWLQEEKSDSDQQRTTDSVDFLSELLSRIQDDEGVKQCPK
jgi:hypothetical protein